MLMSAEYWNLFGSHTIAVPVRINHEGWMPEKCFSPPPAVYLLLIAVSAWVPAQSSMDRGNCSLPSPSPSLRTSKLKHGAPKQIKSLKRCWNQATSHLHGSGFSSFSSCFHSPVWHSWYMRYAVRSISSSTPGSSGSIPGTYTLFSPSASALSSAISTPSSSSLPASSISSISPSSSANVSSPRADILAVCLLPVCVAATWFKPCPPPLLPPPPHPTVAPPPPLYGNPAGSVAINPSASKNSAYKYLSRK